MAITVIQAPDVDDFISAHEDVWVVASSTNAFVSGFKYIFEILRNNQLVSKVVILPNPLDGGNYGTLNVGNITRSFLTTPSLENVNFTAPVNNSLPYESFGNNAFYADFDVRFGEVCGTTTTLNDASGTYRVYNTYNRNRFHAAPLKLNDTNNKFYTNRPDESYYYEGQPVLINVEAWEKVLNHQINLEIYSDGTKISDVVIDFLPSGYARFSLNNLTGSKIELKAFRAQSPNNLFQTKTLYKKCSKYNPYTLFFINSYGCWDSFTFVNGEITTDFEKKKFDVNNWRIGTNNKPVPGFPGVFLPATGVWDRKEKMYFEKSYTYATEFKTKMKLTSDILNTDEYKWLFELFVSPSVYLYDNTVTQSEIDNNSVGYLYPVQITDTNYQLKNSIKNKSEVVEVNIEIDKQNTQFR